MEQASPSQRIAGRTHRARWAAIGAAVAVTLGAGGVGIVSAVVTNNPKSVYVAIAPCRLADTRTGSDNVGPRSTPLVGGDTWTVVGTGDVVGPCNIPAGLSALQLNVTAVGATTGTFLTFFPSDVARSTVSNLNPAPGQPPTPNAVTVTLAASGSFNVYNHAGAVDIVIDIVGYYDTHIHSAADITDEPGVAYNSSVATIALGVATVPIVSTAIRVPADGFLALEATISWYPGAAGWNQLECELTLGSTTMNTSDTEGFFGDEVTLSSSGSYRTQTLNKMVRVSAAANPPGVVSGQPVRLLCRRVNGTAFITSAAVSATYYPTGYAPVVVSPLTDGNADGQVDAGAQPLDPTASVDQPGPESNGRAPDD